MNKILVLGQVPPPFGGQAIMIKNLIDAQYEGVELIFLEMKFSKEFNQLRKINFRKLFLPIFIVLKAYYYRFVKGVKVFYYPPSGPSSLPFLRDVVILFFLRLVFDKCIFHFHAAGGSSIVDKLPFFVHPIVKKAFYYADASIILSEYNPRDDQFFQSKKVFVVPNGISDTRPLNFTREYKSSDAITILYVGLLKASKGITDLVEAFSILVNEGFDLRLRLVGDFESADYKNIIDNKVYEYKLSEKVVFTGVLIGDDKNFEYEQADIFCFPTYFECESFGIVAVEAMQYSLPLVLSSWRGVKSLVKEDEGLYFNPHDIDDLVAKLRELIGDHELRRTVGENARGRYESSYTDQMFVNSMASVFEEVLNE